MVGANQWNCLWFLLLCHNLFLQPSIWEAWGEDKIFRRSNQRVWLKFVARISCLSFREAFLEGTQLPRHHPFASIHQLLLHSPRMLWRVTYYRIYTTLQLPIPTLYISQNSLLYRQWNRWLYHRMPKGTSRWRKLRISWTFDLFCLSRLQSTFLFWLLWKYYNAQFKASFSILT